MSRMETVESSGPSAGRRRRSRLSRRRSLSPLWAKVPFSLFRFPGLLVAVVVGSLLLAVSAAAYPLFISATESDLVNIGIHDPTVTRHEAGLTYFSAYNSFTATGRRDDAKPLYVRRTRVFSREAARSPHLAPTVLTMAGPAVSISPAAGGSASRDGRLFAGTGALEQVQIIAGREGPGVWLPDLITDALHLRPGDEIVLSGEGRERTVVVDGIYASLYSRPLSGYWLRWRDQFVPCADCAPPPQPVLMDQDQLAEVAPALGGGTGTFAWQAPVVGRPLTLDQARELDRFADRFVARLSDPTTELGKAFCSGHQFAAGVCDPVFGLNPESGSAIGQVVAKVDERIAATEGPGRLLQAAGVFVGLIVLGAAGAFSVAARRVEADLLFARGMSPAAVTAKSCVEALLPSVAGTLAGLGLAFALVGLVGPDAPLEPRARITALTTALVAAPVAIVVLGIVSAVAFLRRSEHHAARLAVLARIPWEAGVAALGVFALVRLRDSSPFEGLSGEAVRPSGLLLLIPVLFVSGFAMLAARLLVLGLRRLRARSKGFSASSYTLVHRLAGAPGLTIVLFTCCALCLGVFIYAQAVAGSMRSTVEAKAKVFVGSDVQAQVALLAPLPERAAVPVTKVTRWLNAGDLPGDGAPFDLLAVDPATLPSAAYWHDSFADLGLEEIVAALSQPADAMPVVLVGEASLDPAFLTLARRQVAVEIVARAHVFPGMASDRPLVVVEEAALRNAFRGAPDPLTAPAANTQFWIKGTLEEAERVFVGTPWRPWQFLTAEEVQDIPYIAAVVETFVALNVLSLTAGVLVIAALVMYLQARQRAQVVSYALSLRMGMRDEAYRRSLVAELGGMLVSSYAVGLALALLAAFLVVSTIDPLPAIPPEPLFLIPALVAALAVLVLAAASWAGGRLTNRRARQADLGQVMRLAD